jgi:hypothetical protein
MGNKDVEAEELPFSKAFGLFYVPKRVTAEDATALRILLEKFTFAALDHGMLSQKEKLY